MKLSVGELVQATGGRLISGYPKTLCQRISIDTRTLKPGNVFFALRGPRFDGHHFVTTAAQKGAKAIVLERLDTVGASQPASHRPDLIQVTDSLKALQDVARYVRSRITKTKFIGLTGSNGKTTTKEMLASILKRMGRTLATRGNLNNHIGLPLMMAEVEREDAYAVLEMGTSMKGDMALLVDIAKPSVGLITNVGKDHLEFLGTPEGVLEENRLLFDALPKEGIAVINMEDPLLRSLIGHLPMKVVTYGREPEAEVRAADIVPYPAPLTFTLFLRQDKHTVKLPTLGEVQVLNAMAAAAVAYALGISGSDIVEGLQSYKPAPMRMEAHARPDGAIVVNDAYNANPSSMRASIESFCRSYPDKARWLVLGDMRELGSIAKQEHEELGRWIGTQPVERVFLYGRDTRFILQGLKAQGYGGVIERCKKKRYLIETLRRTIEEKPKAAVLFKASRSLQLEQVSHALLSLPS